MDAKLQQHIIRTYRKRAERYDFTANLYYLFGYREWAYRHSAVKALQLEPGDTVVEIACGTGLNFSLYQEAIGSQGKIIGVDLTDAMLDKARQRIDQHGWTNVTLVHSDALDYDFPSQVDGIISTYALSLIPGLEQVLQNGVNALAVGGRLALLELQIPDYWPSWMASIGVAVMKPFAVKQEWVARRPWETIKSTMNALLTGVITLERYLGLTYIIAGEKAD
jgi:demethylmenaquinone methyltransferase/2-methoxy-6-polyprenyl-1,4-benzoquinol methylase